MDRRRPRRAWTLLLAIALLVVSGPGATAARTGPATPTDAHRAAAAVIATDPVAALAASLDYDQVRIFRFVTDTIRYEPYPGLLRGAQGTLEARAGNAVDKSVLLAALLNASLIRTRFARGPIDDATQAAILATLPADAATARTLATAPLAAGLEQLEATGPTTPPPASDQFGTFDDAQIQAAQDAGAARLQTAKDWLTSTVSMLEGALAGAGIELPADAPLALPASESAARTWVQVAAGPTWVDLDPTLPGAEPGTTLTQPTEILDALPDDLRTSITFDVLVEEVAGDTLTTDTALTFTGFADELARGPITFGHVTPAGLQKLGHSLSSLLGDGWLDHRPVLQMDGHSLIATQSVGFPSGDGTDLFGEPLASAGAGPVDGEAAAEWLEMTVTPPGGEPETSRRTIFDRIPAELRATGQATPAALTPIELIDVDGQGTMGFAPMLGVRTFAIATGPTTAVSLAGEVSDAVGLVSRSYHGVRDVMNAAMALDSGSRTYLDGPNIVALTVTPTGDASPQTVQVGLDIWQRHHGVLPLADPTLGTAARSELVAGVLGQVAERFAVETMAAAPGGPTTTIGVTEVFEQAAADGTGTLVLRGTAPDDLPFGPEATQRIRAAVAAGDVVVVPAAPVRLGDRDRIGWWQIDPATGATTDVMDDGAGQDTAEYTVIVDSEFGRLICIGSMAMAAAEMILAAASLLGSYGASSIYWTFAEGSGVGGTSCAA